MTDTKRDLWSWAELLISVVSGIAIPLLLGYFGWQYRLDQQEACNTDRIRHATELLASEHWRERVMGGGSCGTTAPGINSIRMLGDFSTDYDTIPNHFELWLTP
jgi:hypothetical protein